MKNKQRVYSEGNEVKLSPFPHRSLRNGEVKAIIGDKDIPLHKIRFKKTYQGKKIGKDDFDRWAYVPFK